MCQKSDEWGHLLAQVDGGYRCMCCGHFIAEDEGDTWEHESGGQKETGSSMQLGLEIPPVPDAIC